MSRRRQQKDGGRNGQMLMTDINVYYFQNVQINSVIFIAYIYQFIHSFILVIPNIFFHLYIIMIYNYHSTALYHSIHSV